LFTFGVLDKQVLVKMLFAATATAAAVAATAQALAVSTPKSSALFNHHQCDLCFVL
jgi:hypothetical protein